MIEEQIKQRAEEYAEQHKMRTDFGYGWQETYDTKQQAEAYIAGAHSRDEDIEILKDLFSNSQRYAHSLKESVKSMGEQLKNAVSMLKDIYEDDDYFCTMLLDIDEEAKICEKCCDNLNEKCILRYLKHYKKEQ